MRLTLIFAFLLGISQTVLSQNIQETGVKNQTQAQAYSYAYITIEGKGLGKKLKVEVDLGDKPEQISLGEQYSETLTNKKSFAAILNYMAKEQYELVESFDNSFSLSGVGGTSAIILIMRKKL